MTEHPSSRALNDYLGRPPGRPVRRFLRSLLLMLRGEISAGAVTGWCYGAVSMMRS